MDTRYILIEKEINKYWPITIQSPNDEIDFFGSAQNQIMNNIISSSQFPSDVLLLCHCRIRCHMYYFIIKTLEDWWIVEMRTKCLSVMKEMTASYLTLN